MTDTQKETCQPIICKQQFELLTEGIEAIKEGQTLLTHRLFQDNGNECIQSKLNRHDGWIRRVDNRTKSMLGWLGGGVITGASIKALFDYIF